MTELELLKKKLARAEAARKQAEDILEAKALELYEANQSLLAFNASLEEEIEVRSQQLLSKENQYKALINNASDIIFTVDEEGYFLMINPIGLQKFGYKQEDIIGARYVDFILEDYREEVFVYYTRIKEENIAESYLEFPVLTANNDVIWVGQSVTKLEEQGKVLFSAVARDITEKVNNLQELKKVNSRFSALLENMIDGILVEDENRKVVLVNQAFISLFNIPLTPEEMVGLDCADLALAAADYFVEPDQFMERILEIIRNQEIVIDEELPTKDGKVFSRNFIPILIDGENQGTLWYYSDISDRRNREIILKRSEEKYRGIIENMELGILEVDTEGEIIRAYDRFNEMTGYTNEELIGKKAKETLVVDEYSRTFAEQTIKRKNGISSAFEMKIRRKDQSEIWVLVSGAPFYNEKGQVVGSIGLHYDITSRKELEHDLKMAKDVAEKAQQAEKQFLASMSHEIRTPLNAIIGMTHLLADTRLESDQQEYLEVLSNSASLLRNLISDILDISKIDADTIEIQEKPVDIGLIGKKILPTISVKAREKDLQFQFNLDDGIRNTVLSDNQLLSQVLLNLLSNAEKFTAAGSIDLTVNLEKETDTHYHLYFAVTDTGIGMTDREASLVFDQFTQANAAIRNEYGGTGLGLSISKRLVSLMGGELEVKSKKGKGSTFYFRLVLKKGPLLLKEKTNSLTVKDDRSLFSNKKALIVEDNLMNIKYLSTLLKKWGFQFSIANNGQEAVDIFGENDFDIIFMDLQMPVMDGYEASKKIRAMDARGEIVPIIALTASTFLSKKELAMKAGISDFVSKPFTPDQLLNVVGRLLNTTGQPQEVATEFSFSDRLDRAYLKKIYGSDTAYAFEVFSIFLDIIDGEFDSIFAALKAEDPNELQRSLHKIKPTFSMVGLTGITKKLEILEKNVAQQSIQESRQQVDELFEALASIKPLLEAEKSALYKQLNVTP
ncbi:PAS domain S-box protein [Neolewinella agarilytica]|uniref:Sensory/regulatory protein RpfC n=1 Tax=Neolewinella agarilytica TaxID=478744 RepID=A0A1H9ARX0_9BACT|nr:PAS domain S-box protein [Neolewinella agarilytica]SEP79285.1 PAS domain S-box-containing protein [Neolewinella agarilytica]